MPDAFGPFDNAPWSEAQWYRYAHAWAPDGILTAGDLALTTSGLSLTPGVGRAWVGGAGFERTAPVGSLAVTPNTHSSYSRRDRVILRRSLAARTVRLMVLEGSASATPAAAALKREPIGEWDLPLWTFLVPPNSGTAISGIVDERVVSSARQLMSGTSLPSYAPEGAIFFLES